jgi:hypothetical protein
MSRLSVRLSALLLLAACALPAAAQTRAWLDRDRIALGETTTLNIETDQATAASPDYSPLLGDFTVTGNTSSRQFEMVNGVSQTRALFAVALQPRREGLIGIPPLLVGSRRTQPLNLTVTAAAAAPTHGGTVFIESEADAQEPYVQQAVGYTVRLYYATPLVSGQLDQATPDGAVLQRVGEDTQHARDIGGHVYTVVERHYLLIPERSGTLVIPGAQFHGKGAGGFFDDLLGDGDRDLHANSAPRFLKVRAAPVDAPQPWLPLRALSLRYLATPQRGRAGEAMTITVEATADGASAAQMPELQLPVTDGAQVFADPPQHDETFTDGRPQVRMVRKFSIVPARSGTLRISGPRMGWWDVRAGIARTASLADISVQVAPGANGFGATPAPTTGVEATPGQSSDGISVPGIQGEVRPWALATVIFAVLWLATLMWGLHRRAHQSIVVDGQPQQPGAPSTSASATLPDLKRALDRGELADVADVLCAMASPPVADLDALRFRLEDRSQIAAVDALQRARWSDGDGVAARTALRDAFKHGPRWGARGKAVVDEALPPLYPRR